MTFKKYRRETSTLFVCCIIYFCQEPISCFDLIKSLRRGGTAIAASTRVVIAEDDDNC